MNTGLLTSFMCLLVVVLTTPVDSALNKKPIIGILSQEMSPGMIEHFGDEGYVYYIASSYVKYFESGGARVVPILINQDDDYYQKIVSSVNGIVFPGGGNSITDRSGYGRAGRVLYDLVQEAANEGTQIALIGICLGFQMLMYLAGKGGSTPLKKCSAKDRADPLHFRDGWEDSQLFGEAPNDIITTLTTTSSTSNFHNYCVTEQTFNEHDLDSNFNILATSFDEAGLEYIANVEHKTLPIYGFQWHPEKNLFEWVYGSIPHTREAVWAAGYFANLFIEKARHNLQKFDDPDEEAEMLIYNFDSIYVRKYFKSTHMECYFFKDQLPETTTP